MKRHIPFCVLTLFILLLLWLCAPILTHQQLVEAQKVYEAERHLVVYSNLPQDVNSQLAASFYHDKNLRVQILSLEDGAMQQSLARQERQPDILIASEETLQVEKKKGLLQPYASRVTEKVPANLTDPEQQWTGLWVDPMVIVLSRDYYESRNLQLTNWDDLLTDAAMTLAFPDLGATDMAGEFLCSYVEVHGMEASKRYFQALQKHVGTYSTSMAANVRRAAGGEVNVAVADAAMARQYQHDGAPIYLLYPQDGTSYWLTGVAVTNWCVDGELTNLFVDWLYSPAANKVLERNHIFLTSAVGHAEKDAQGRQLVLFPVKKQYTAAGRRALQDWWIKTVRFGKE